MTEYRVRAVMIKPHPMIPSIPRARKFLAEKKVRFLFCVPVWRQVDGLLWYHSAEEAWEAVRRDAGPEGDKAQEQASAGAGDPPRTAANPADR